MSFIGNKKIVSLLEQSRAQKRLAQAYLFAGPERVGKRTLAERFALELITGKDFAALSENEITQARFDLLSLSPEEVEKRGVTKEKAISVEQVREAIGALATYPYAGLRKVLVVDGADKLRREAQNALLKTLEEPNSTSTIILVANDRQSLLPTIRSRCRHINFSLVSTKELQLLGTEFSEAIPLSLGRPGLAISLAQNKKALTETREWSEQMKQLEGQSVTERMRLSERLSKNVPKAIEQLKFLLWQVHERSTDVTSLALAGKIAATIQTLETTNANARLAIDALLLDL
ncbi:DNA polymerase III subunit delta' [Patescibacteria group bacterium]|nr:MAG: DNA polymerase III subunit delta' [Patescibacteria group bacterium]